MIRGYSEEAGVRSLHRQLVSLARKAATRLVQEGEGRGREIHPIREREALLRIRISDEATNGIGVFP